MCGIVGMAGKLDHSHRAAFKDLLTVCQVRGRDSTGVIRVKGNNEYLWVKNVGTPEYLLDTKMYDKQIDQHDTKVLIGHCRAKTIGDVSAKNAHPFDFPGKVCGVHNGTLRSTYKMERDRDFQVDSELLYWHIGEYGLEKTITEEVDPAGAWALVYWNAEENTVNFLRNNERPLFFTHSEDRKVMFWASEPWMFSAVSRRMKLWDGGEESKAIYALPENSHYSFRIDSSKMIPNEIFTMTGPKEIKAEVRSYSGNYPTSLTNNRGSSGNHYHGGQVARPFPQKNDLLDDNLDGIGGRILDQHGKVIQLPSRANMRTLGVSIPSTTPGGTSSITSPSGSDTPTDSKNSSNTPKPKLSLPSPSSSGSQRGLSEKQSNVWGDFSKTSSVPQSYGKRCSTRRVAGLDYITDLRTGKEYPERRIEEETGGYCSFCRSPIGDLSEIHEINEFVSHGETELTFICSSCIVPQVA